MLTVARNAENVIAPLRIVDDASAAIVGLVFNTAGLSVEFKLPGDTGWTSIDLAAGTVGTWSDGGFVADSGDDGWYQLGMPAAAIVAGMTTRLRIKTAGNAYRYGFVSATGAAGDVSQLSAAVAVLLKTSVIRSAGGLTITELSAVRGTTWALPIPITLPDGWTRIEVTARKESSDLQGESALHLAATNGGDAEDGLLIVAGVDANMNHGSIDTSGEVPLLRLDAAASTLLPIDQLCWDAKVWVGGTVTQEARGTISVEKDITRTVSAG